MPKRARGRDKRRKGGAPQPRTNTHDHNGNPSRQAQHAHSHHHPHHHEDDADIPQIPGIPLPHVAALLKEKIAEIEKTQQEAEDEALLNSGESLRRISSWENRWNSTAATIENDGCRQQCDEQVQELLELFRRISNLFYSTLAERRTLQFNSTKLIKQNETFQELCRRLQAENKSTQKRFGELHEREQVWRKELEDHFQSSLQEIKGKINEHEERYTKVLEENEELRRKLSEFVEYDNKRTSEFNSYRTQQARIMDMQEKENDSLKIMLENKIKQAKELEGNLKEAININRMMKTRQEQTNGQLETYQKTLQDSTRCIDQVKTMNSKTMKANKDLQKQYRDLSNLHLALQKKNSRMERQIETLSNLSRELSKKNREQTSRIHDLEAMIPDEGDERPDEEDDDDEDVGRHELLQGVPDDKDAEDQNPSEVEEDVESKNDNDDETHGEDDDDESDQEGGDNDVSLY